MTSRPGPADPRSLEEADRQLAMLEDVIAEERGEVPAWVIAAREAVQTRLPEVRGHEA